MKFKKWLNLIDYINYFLENYSYISFKIFTLQEDFPRVIDLHGAIGRKTKPSAGFPF